MYLWLYRLKAASVKLLLEVETNGCLLVGKRLSFVVRVRQRLCLACGSLSTTVFVAKR